MAEELDSRRQLLHTLPAVHRSGTDSHASMPSNSSTGSVSIEAKKDNDSEVLGL
jgi:hypothetical protein